MPTSLGYVNSVDENLFQPLSPRARTAFESAAGAELRAGQQGRPKMAALHSSAALAVNVFDYWSDQSLSVLLRALGAPTEAERLDFERQFPTGLRGTPPNLDVVLTAADGAVVAIESKYTEWLDKAASRVSGFSASYFSNQRELWSAKGLPRWQRLAHEIHVGERRFASLNAPQLLKHALGLAGEGSRRFCLFYLFYDIDGPESSGHREELVEFAEAVAGDSDFRWMTYQTFFARLSSRVNASDAPYVNYLRDRYFGGPART